MFVERLAEMSRGVNHGLERARAEVDQFLNNERESRRWPFLSKLAEVGTGLAPFYGMIMVSHHIIYPALEPMVPSNFGSFGIFALEVTIKIGLPYGSSLACIIVMGKLLEMESTRMSSSLPIKESCQERKI